MKRYVRVLFICHGNICRSPMCHYYFQHLLVSRGLEAQFYVDSAATSREEIGNPVHPKTREKLVQHHIPCGNHRARQLQKEDYKTFDYLIGMDSWNLRNIKAITGGDPDNKIFKLMEFAGSGCDVADPWYTGDFDATWEDVHRGCDGLLKEILSSHSY